MTDKEILIKQIIYRSIHRGTKEMDLLLGNFVKKYIKTFNLNELKAMGYKPFVVGLIAALTVGMVSIISLEIFLKIFLY